MKAAKDLSNAIKQLVGSSDKVIATVTSVDKDKSCCDVEIDGNELGNIRLQAIVKENVKGCKYYPAVGSKVVVEQLNDKGDWMVTMLSEIEEVLFEIGTSKYQLKANGFLIKKGDDTLKQVLTLLVESIQPIVVVYGNNPNYVKLNQALTKINNLLQ